MFFICPLSYETFLLENVMVKIGGLLQVGFGEAGGAIIGKNIRRRGHLDCLIPGVKVRIMRVAVTVAYL